MLTRRELVQNAMALSVWPSLRPLAAAALQQIQSEGADDETFWAYVRLEFQLTPEFTNLLSVVRGNFTRAIREIAFNETTRHNQLSAPLPDLNYQWETRRKVASFIGASAENIALLRNTTEGVTTVLSNWPLKAGDEILTSSAEHGPFYDTLAQLGSRELWRRPEI